MGQDGYMKIAGEVYAVTQKIIAAVEGIKGIKLVCRPDMTALAIMSDDPKINILALADVMEEKGWQMERQQCPDSLHVRHVAAPSYSTYFFLPFFLPLFVLFFGCFVVESVVGALFVVCRIVGWLLHLVCNRL
jgi:hypothetical protein